MSRIGTYGAAQMYLTRIMSSQERLNTLQNQVATEKKSPNYTGLSTDSTRLINFENSISQANSFKQNNDVATTRLSTAQTAVDSVQTAIKDFRDILDNFATGNTTDPERIKDVQKWAVQSMAEIQSYLNTDVDGQYLFSGGRISTEPVQLTTTDITTFQSIYDGYNTTYPTTRAAHLQDVALTNDDTGTVTFQANRGAIIPANAGAFSKVNSGSLVTVGGTTNNNDDITVTGHLATNVNGKVMTETASAGAGAYITASTGNLTNATTGNLAFAFDADGNMVVTPTNANTLSDLSPGMRITIQGSTDADADGFGDHDGAFVVSKVANGSITLVTDTKMAEVETMDVANLTLTADSADADSIPDTAVGLGAISGDAKFTVSGNTVTLTVPSGGTSLSTLFSAGDPITIAGSLDHDGSFQVSAVTANTVSFQINPDALRTSQFVPQSGRTDVTLDFEGRTVVLDATAAYGSLTFSPTGGGGETITAANANAFTDASGNISPKIGDLLTLSSTSGVNDGVYKVISNDGTNIVVESNTISNDSSTTATFNSTSWYKGDTSTLTHRVDTQASIDIGLQAADPAFEKALRAMGLIAQGVTGTAGGLDQNQDRIAAARYLISDALNSPSSGTPPYGEEDHRDIETLSSNIGTTQALLSQRNEKHTTFIGLFQARADSIENVDKTEAIVKLLDEQRAMEASYQTLATVRGLSLLNYMS